MAALADATAVAHRNGHGVAAVIGVGMGSGDASGPTGLADRSGFRGCAVAPVDGSRVSIVGVCIIEGRGEGGVRSLIGGLIRNPIDRRGAIGILWDARSPDREFIDDLAVDVLEIPTGLSRVSVDMEFDKQGAELRPLVGGVDASPLVVATVGIRRGLTSLLVPKATTAQP